ncbi:TlpA disulfide reductase family protein [Streptomyces sp. BPTC-684]|uniref:TlpA family protein disulfide reductase n=1 Tax=Streptomyces sp. BPTC-684 TaxID=3043734 RepID=UPI0024B0AA7E|nr:TlpA disulfide reductase family protein [Streptomyces sp. BPTC-684]WHM40996.1 TlpA disulfide reductase family protein [Streptomyces sp. BPTC-684]
MIKPARRAALAAAICLLSLSACSGAGHRADPVPGPSGGTGSALPGITQVAPADRTAAPVLTGKDLDDRPLSLADYRGQVVVLNVWGSWCPPCRAEAKHFRKVATETRAQGVRFVGINARDPNKEPARQFEREHKLGFPSFHDPIGKLLLRFPKGTLNLQFIPATLVIDREGRIAARAQLPLDAERLHRMIDPVVTEK